MPDGVVVVAGVFEAGSVVTLTLVADEGVQRPEGGQEVAKRIVDSDGNVGWDGLEIGSPYIAHGYINGWYALLRCKGVDVSEPSNDLSQAPPPAPPQKIGTDEVEVSDPLPEPPAVEEGAEPLPVGLPDGVPISQIGAKLYYLHVGDGAIGELWHDSGLQAPAEVAADESTIDARPLYTYTGDEDPNLEVDLEGRAQWESYEGPTEPAGTTPEASVFTDTPAPAAEAPADAPPAEPAPADTPPPVEPPPPAADAPPATEPVPSESAGTGDQAGAPSEPPAPVEAPADAPPPAEPTPVGATDQAPEGGAPAVAEPQGAPAEPAPPVEAAPSGADAPAAPAPADQPPAPADGEPAPDQVAPAADAPPADGAAPNPDAPVA